MNRIKLFFIPHAGGSAMGYMVMKHKLDLSMIEPIPLEPAGRGTRTNETGFTDIRQCMEDLCKHIRPQIQDCKYAIFGHSLGSLLAFELVRHLEEAGEKPPVCAIFSGRVAPPCVCPAPILSSLEDKEFIKHFSRFQALPQEILQNEKILELVLPTLRADVKMAEEYNYTRKSPLSSDFYMFYGKDDMLICPEEMELWGKETTGKSDTFVFPGGHFYFKEHVDLFTEKINEIILRYASQEVTHD